MSKLKPEMSVYALHILGKEWEAGIFEEGDTLDARRLAYPLCLHAGQVFFIGRIHSARPSTFDT